MIAFIEQSFGKLYVHSSFYSGQDNLLLDMYLAPHVRTLYTQIRNRALIQVAVFTCDCILTLLCSFFHWIQCRVTLRVFPCLCFFLDFSLYFQYFSPYVSADMRKMATAFNTTVAALEDELTQLILEGLINARIDSHSKVSPGRTSAPKWLLLKANGRLERIKT